MRTDLLHELNDERAEAKRVSLYVLRLDLLHPQYGGNKWFKLKYNLAEAKEKGADRVLTFGGAFSNHLAATAAVAKAQGLRSVGIIRGEETQPLNPTLSFARAQGMELAYMDRETYRRKNEAEVREKLQREFPGACIIPEGGANLQGVKGCTEILPFVPVEFDAVCVACGTGATLAGLALSLREGQRAIGFPVLKGGAFLQEEIATLLREYANASGGAIPQNWSLQNEYHFGGYAKTDERLLSFIKEMKQAHRLSLDHVYTGKLFCGVFDLLENDFFAAGERVLLLHTGGLQGSVLPEK